MNIFLILLEKQNSYTGNFPLQAAGWVESFQLLYISTYIALFYDGYQKLLVMKQCFFSRFIAEIYCYLALQLLISSVEFYFHDYISSLQTLPVRSRRRAYIGNAHYLDNSVYTDNLSIPFYMKYSW
jgi:hypothetical protein